MSDPQTAVRNPSLLYEFHVSGKTFNARGCGVAGSPVILIGWTEDVAWGVTALGADQADLFRLKTDSAHPDQYFFDGEWRDMKIFEENIKVKNGRSQKITIRETHFGPVATEFSFVRPNEGEIALKRIPVAETDRETIQGAIAMMRAKNVYQFAGAIEGWRFPSANIVFGDKEGNIGYWSLCANPIRSAYALEAGSAAHDGTESKFDWQGIVPYDLLPHVINPKRGFLATANHRTIGSFYNIPLGVSTGAGGHTGRSWRLYELLEKKEIFTPEDILDIHYDSVSPFRGDIVRIGLHLQDVLKEELLPETYMALALLGPWHKNGASSDLRSEGAEIATKINTMFRMVTTDLTQIYGGGESGLAYFLRTVTFRIENDPNAPINDLEKEYIDVVLADAWINTERAFGYDITKWQQRALNQVKRRKLGYFESLDGFPSLNPAHDITFPGITNVDGGTIKSQAGQAYTQWVPLHDVDSALSIMPVGTSELPDNPFRFSTLEKWGKGELHPAPITREGVEKYKVSSVVISR